jgi:uroporphyrinogen decarboxylase
MDTEMEAGSTETNNAMSKREVIKQVLAGAAPPYVPWSFRFTKEAKEKLIAHFGNDDLLNVLGDHILELGSDIGFFEDMGGDCARDVFGVVWDRAVDKDIGNVQGRVLPEATLAGYTFPDPLDPRFFADIPPKTRCYPDRFRLFCLGFSLYERAWTMRGMDTLMMDFYDHPRFVRELFNAIVEYNLAQVRAALKYDIDAVYFGDDWGQQRGLQMGYPLWKEFIFPVLKRMYGAVRESGKFVFIHSCGDVDELFDDLVAIGLNCFNPFQPEVMDTAALLKKYRGRLSYWGGLSTQRTLPYGTPDDVRRETQRLIDLGRDGNFILSPAHAVEGDVPLENMLAFVQVAQAQVR